MDGPALLALQLLDTELDQLAGQRRRLPEHLALDEATRARAALDAERRRLEQVVAEAEATIERLEHEGADLDTKKRRLEAQLKTVIAPREAEALMHEIAAIDEKHAGLDDVELEAMDQQAQAEEALARLAADEPAVVAAQDDAQRALDAAVAEITTAEAAVQERREAARAALTSTELATYDSLRARFGGVGIVQIEAKRCTGCHLDLSATELDEVKAAPAGELPECPHCARLIVR